MECLESWKKAEIHLGFNETLLVCYHLPLFPSQWVPPPPPPEVIDDHIEYKVERVLDARMCRGKVQFLVKWKGYRQGHENWEPEENLVGTSDEAIADFYRAHPSAPRKISAAIFHSLPWQAYENFTEMVAGTSTVEGG